MSGFLKYYQEAFQRQASGKAALLSLLILVIASVGMSLLVGHFSALMQGRMPLDLTLFYGPATAREFLAALTPEASDFYQRAILPADMLYPLTYALTISVIVAWLVAKIQRGGATAPRWLIAYALIPAAFDYFENVCFKLMMSNVSGGSDSLLAVASAGSALKWATALIGEGLLVYLLVRYWNTRQTRGHS